MKRKNAAPSSAGRRTIFHRPAAKPAAVKKVTTASTSGATDVPPPRKATPKTAAQRAIAQPATLRRRGVTLVRSVT
jgi:hypothetical protein